MKEHLNAEDAALIIVDMQNDFCHETGKCALLGRNVAGAQAIVPAISSLIASCRKLDVPVVFIQMTQEPHTLSEAWYKRPRTYDTPDTIVCEKGSWGADFYKLEPQSGDIIVEKHRYSAFIGTPLDQILRSLNRKSLIITGVATNVCVESTARDGFMLDYHVTVIKDGVAGYTPALHEAAFGNISNHFGYVLNASDVTGYWENGELIAV